MKEIVRAVRNNLRYHRADEARVYTAIEEDFSPLIHRNGQTTPIRTERIDVAVVAPDSKTKKLRAEDEYHTNVSRVFFGLAYLLDIHVNKPKALYRFERANARRRARRYGKMRSRHTEFPKPLPSFNGVDLAA